MSGSPTESEIQTQWRNAVDILEQTRNFVDDTMAADAGPFDVLLKSLEGDYTPADLAAAVNRYRAGFSALIEPGTVLSFLTAVARYLITGDDTGALRICSSSRHWLSM